MKLIIMLLFSYTAGATNYFVKSTGSDLANGLSNGTAWQNVSKVNGFSFSSGDSIFFNRGDSWHEKLNPISSNIYIGPYGTGNKPVFTGFQTATGWTDSSGIWYTTLTGSVPYQNTIMIDGVLRKKGRYPNSTYLTSYPNSLTRLTPEQVLPANYVGAEAVTGGYVWIWDINKIIAQTADSLNLQTPMTYAFPNTRINYFIQNSVHVLDQNYEWAYDSTTKKIWVKLDHEPNLQYSTLDTVISNHNISYVTYDNITVTGGNRINFSADSGRYITLQNSTISNSGMNGVGLNNSPRTVLYNDSIVDALNNGFYTRQRSDTCTITYSYFKRCGLYQGMNLSGNAASLGIYMFGSSANFRNNIVDSIGYNGYQWMSLRDTVMYNYITNYCLAKADGGAIYTDGVSLTLPQTGSLLRGNIIKRGIGVIGGTAAGIYLDNQSTGIRVDSNTIDSTSGAGIALNGGTNYTVKYNTVRTNASYAFYVGNGIAFSSSTIIGNTFYSTYRNLALVYFGNGAGSSTEDSNRVLRANAPDSLFHDGGSTYYGLAAWRTATGLDANTTTSFPSGITAANGVLYTNTTSSAVVQYLTGLYLDERGSQYNNSITIQPFKSALLFKADHEISVPSRVLRKTFKLIQQ